MDGEKTLQGGPTDGSNDAESLGKGKHGEQLGTTVGGIDEETQTPSDSTSNTTGKKLHRLVVRPESVLGKPPSGIITDHRTIQDLIKKHPATKPHVKLIAQVEAAQAAAEVAFRERELRESWESWSGVHPWDDKEDLEKTECPWWLAGGDYVASLSAAWRNHAPVSPKDMDLVVQVQLFAKYVYGKKVFFHDLMKSKNPKAHDLFSERNTKRFSDFALLLTLQRFKDDDLAEWRNRAALTKASESQLAPSAADVKEVSDLGSRLDAAATSLNISHEEQAVRIGIGRTTYFDLKKGLGGKTARRRAENYLRNLGVPNNPD